MTELYGGSDNVHSFCGAIQLFKVALPGALHNRPMTCDDNSRRQTRFG